jgi:hypothetical protein
MIVPQWLSAPSFGEHNIIQAYGGHQELLSKGKAPQFRPAVCLHEMVFNSGMDKFQVPNHLGK